MYLWLECLLPAQCRPCTWLDVFPIHLLYQDNQVQCLLLLCMYSGRHFFDVTSELQLCADTHCFNVVACFLACMTWHLLLLRNLVALWLVVGGREFTQMANSTLLIEIVKCFHNCFWLSCMLYLIKISSKCSLYLCIVSVPFLSWTECCFLMNIRVKSLLIFSPPCPSGC